MVIVVIVFAEIKQRLKRDSIGRSVLDDPEMPGDDELTGPKSNPDPMIVDNKRHTRAIQRKLLYAGFGVLITGPVIAYFLAVVVCQIKQRFRLPLRNKQHDEEGECNIITCFHTKYKVYNTYQVPAVYSCEWLEIFMKHMYK